MSSTNGRYAPLFATIAWIATFSISVGWFVWAAAVAFVDFFLLSGVLTPSTASGKASAAALTIPPAIAFFCIAALWAYLPHHAPPTARATAVFVLIVSALAALFVGVDVVTGLLV